jgi:hypothetical protein
MRTELAEAQKERDSLIVAIRVIGPTSTRSSPAPEGSRKTTKLPDPPILDNSKKVQFKA